MIIRKTKQSGQSTIEYMLVFAIVIVVLLVALAPKGFFTVAINDSLNLSIEGLERMAANAYLNVYEE